MYTKTGQILPNVYHFDFAIMRGSALRDTDKQISTGGSVRKFTLFRNVVHRVTVFFIQADGCLTNAFRLFAKN